MNSGRCCGALIFFFLATCCGSLQADEHGQLKLYFLQNPVGLESYDLTASHNELLLKSSFGYTERQTTIHLDAALRMKSDFTPLEFSANGKSYRPFSVHAKFAVDPDTNSATVKDGSASRRVGIPSQFFTVSGYAPLSVQM